MPASYPKKISSLEEFNNFLNSSYFSETAFSRLSSDDLAFFVGQLKFSDEGFPGGYWGDIAKNESMSDAQLGSFVSDFFGVDRNEFEKCLHKFGTMNGSCTSRPYYNCPYC